MVHRSDIADEVIEVIVEPNPSFGGDTYWLCTTDWPDEFRAICYRPRSIRFGGGKCAAIAGAGTDHVGIGACEYHNGAYNELVAIGRMTTGKAAVKTRNSLSARIDDFIADDQQDLFDLTKELATLRILFRDMVEKFDYIPDDEQGIHARRIVEMVIAIRQCVEGISKIQSRNALTAAHVAYLRVTVADILIKFIDDPSKRERAVKALAQRIAGGEDGDDTKIIKLAQNL